MFQLKKYQFSQINGGMWRGVRWRRGSMRGEYWHYIWQIWRNEKQGVIICKVKSSREGELLHSLWGRRCGGYRAATASRIAEGSGKDRDSFGFDFRVVAAVIPPPWGPLPGPGPDKLQSSVIQLLPLQFCQRAHRLIIPVFSRSLL